MTHDLKSIYYGIKTRCYNKNNKGYPNYGARGIKMCSEWENSFEAFCKDVGERPESMTLDRIDGGGHYCPENCRWADNSVQIYNKKKLNKSTYIKRVKDKEYEVISVRFKFKDFKIVRDFRMRDMDKVDSFIEKCDNYIKEQIIPNYTEPLACNKITKI